MGGTVFVSETPLSDLIANYVETATHESYARFLEAFRYAKLGVVASGAEAVNIFETRGGGF